MEKTRRYIAPILISLGLIGGGVYENSKSFRHVHLIQSHIAQIFERMNPPKIKTQNEQYYELQSLLEGLQRVFNDGILLEHDLPLTNIQISTESRFEKDAESETRAKGIGQITESVFQDMGGTEETYQKEGEGYRTIGRPHIYIQYIRKLSWKEIQKLPPNLQAPILQIQLTGEKNEANTALRKLTGEIKNNIFDPKTQIFLITLYNSVIEKQESRKEDEFWKNFSKQLDAPMQNSERFYQRLEKSVGHILSVPYGAIKTPHIDRGTVGYCRGFIEKNPNLKNDLFVRGKYNGSDTQLPAWENLEEKNIYTLEILMGICIYLAGTPHGDAYTDIEALRKHIETKKEK